MYVFNPFASLESLFCNQAFGRYRPLKGAEKWSRDHHENWKFAHRHVEKFTDSKNAIFSFRSTTTSLGKSDVYYNICNKSGKQNFAHLFTSPKWLALHRIWFERSLGYHNNNNNKMRLLLHDSRTSVQYTLMNEKLHRHNIAHSSNNQ